MNDLSELLNAIKSEINTVVERHLLPHFERMKCNNENIKMIETVLQQMPAFQRLEKENAELKELLKTTTDVQPKEKQNEQAIACAPSSPEKSENIIKLDIVETAIPNEISESEIYQNANLSDKLINTQIEEVEPIEEASEIDEEETEASEAEEEASEAEEEEEEVEEEEEEEEAEEEEEEEEEEENGVEGAEPLEEEEEEEAEEEEEEEENGVEGAEPLEEETLETTTGVEGAEPLEEEVSLIEIKGRGKFYTNNPLNGDIYKVDADEEVGDHIGNFVNGIPVFF